MVAFATVLVVAVHRVPTVDIRGLKGRMWNLAIPIWELVLRSGVVYGFLLVLLRLTGKRQIGQLAPFDLVLLSYFQTLCRIR